MEERQNISIYLGKGGVLVEKNDLISTYKKGRLYCEVVGVAV